MGSVETAGDRLIVRGTARRPLLFAGLASLLLALLTVAAVVKWTHDPPVETTVLCTRADNGCTVSRGGQVARTLKLEAGSAFEVVRMRESKHDVFCPELRRADGYLADLGPQCISYREEQLAGMRAAMKALQGGLAGDAPRWSAAYTTQYTLSDASMFLYLGLLGLLFGPLLILGSRASTTVLDRNAQRITLYTGAATDKASRGSAEYPMSDVAGVLLSPREVKLRLTDGRVRPILITNRIPAAEREAVAQSVAAFLDRPLTRGEA
jgi:hypothetical protein